MLVLLLHVLPVRHMQLYLSSFARKHRRWSSTLNVVWFSSFFFVSDSTEENFLHKTAFLGFVKNRFSFHFIVLLVAIKRMF